MLYPTMYEEVTYSTMKRNKILGIAIGTVLGFSLLWNGVGQQPVHAASPVTIDETNFPDEVFRNYVKDKFDTNGDDVLSVDEIEDVKSINVMRLEIDDLTGVEYFYNLNDLGCNYNNLTDLDLSQNTQLTRLFCGYNQLSSLNVNGCMFLKTLDCNSNQLGSLDVSNNTQLTDLDCNSNQLSAL